MDNAKRVAKAMLSIRSPTPKSKEPPALKKSRCEFLLHKRLGMGVHKNYSCSDSRVYGGDGSGLLDWLW
eukprot:3131935-Amphidinium_carterae.1